MEFLIKLFHYNRWANNRILKILQELPDPPAKALELFVHISSGMDIWLDRLEGKVVKAADSFPNLSLPECRNLEERVYQRMENFLKKVTVHQLKSTIRYKNLKGVEYENGLEDILYHLINHSTYHRGQINKELRQQGKNPAAVDYILYVREGQGITRTG